MPPLEKMPPAASAACCCLVVVAVCPLYPDASQRGQSRPPPAIPLHHEAVDSVYLFLWPAQVKMLRFLSTNIIRPTDKAFPLSQSRRSPGNWSLMGLHDSGLLSAAECPPPTAPREPTRFCHPRADAPPCHPRADADDVYPLSVVRTLLGFAFLFCPRLLLVAISAPMLQGP